MVFPDLRSTMVVPDLRATMEAPDLRSSMVVPDLRSTMEVPDYRLPRQRLTLTNLRSCMMLATLSPRPILTYLRQ